MTIHERHMELIDALNNAATREDYWRHYWMLAGWKDGLRSCGYEPDLIRADMEQIARGFNRPMCGGVFNDWKPSAPEFDPNAYDIDEKRETIVEQRILTSDEAMRAGDGKDGSGAKQDSL